MTTKLYFHSALSKVYGSLPQQLEAGSGAWTSNHISGADAATVNRSMDTNIGTAQVSQACTSTADTLHHLYYFGPKFVSPPLNQTSIAANTWTLNIANQESNTAAAFGSGWCVYLYVWRPSSGTQVGLLVGNGTAFTGGANCSTANSERAENATSAALPSVSCAVGDVLVCELWCNITQTSATARTDTIFFDGTTENSVTNTTVSNYAAFISTPENLSFLPVNIPQTVYVEWEES